MQGATGSSNGPSTRSSTKHDNEQEQQLLETLNQQLQELHVKRREVQRRREVAEVCICYVLP